MVLIVGLRHLREQIEPVLTPLPDPRSIRDFFAFEEHVRKGFAKRDEPVPKEWFELPVYYKTAAHNLLGPDADVHWPSFTQKFDFELELAAVVGRAGRDIKAAEAVFLKVTEMEPGYADGTSRLPRRLRTSSATRS